MQREGTGWDLAAFHSASGTERAILATPVNAADARVSHVSIANPDHAPYGRAAEAAMR